MCIVKGFDKFCFRFVTIVFLIVLIPQSHLAQEVISNFPKHNHVTKDSVILFQVKNVLEVTSYRFQLSGSSSFSVLTVDTLVNSNAVSLDIGSSNQTYFWRSKAYFINDSTEWSQVHKLTVFSPKNIDNSVVWFSSTSVSQANNTPINTLMDLTGNGYNATQPSASLQPTFRTLGGFRNQPFIDFNGTDGMQTLVDNSIIRNDSTLSFVSMQLNRNQGYGALFYLGNSGAFSPQFAGRTAGSSYNNGAFRFLGYNGTVFTFDLQTPNNSYRIISGQNQLTQSRLFSNGIQVGVMGASLVPVNAGAKLKIGCNQDNQENYNGALHELVIYRNTIDTSVLRNTERLIDAMYVPKPNLGNNITQINGLCDSTIVLNPGAGYTSYLWSTGATSPTITINQFGTYSVQTTDNFGYVFTDKIEFRPNVVFKYPSTTNICQNSGIVWNTQISNYNIVWSDGFVGATRLITVPGSYFYDIIDVNQCSVRSDTLLFTIDNYPSTANLGADTNLCSGNLIALQSGAGETVSYLWPDGTTGTQYAVDTTGNYFLESINVNGCVARDTVHINVIGIAPLAEFTTANVCDGLNAVFTDNSVPVGTAPIDGWAWDFGDTTSAITQSPTHTYSAPGNYIVELFVSQGGCGAFHYDTVTVYQNPQALFTFSGHCQGQPIQFNNASTLGNAPLSTYSWDFDMPWTGAYNTSNIPIPYREFDSTGVFDVQFTVTDANGCNSQVTIPVVIDPSPEVTFSMPDGCVNQPITAQFTGVSQNPSTYLWDFGDNAFSILNNTSHTYSVFGDYTVSLSVTNGFNCTVVGQDQIDVFAVPVPSFDLGPYCKGTYVEMTNTSTIAQGAVAQTTWVVNATDTVTGNPGFYLIPELGQQQIQVITTSNEGCSASTFEFIEVEDSLNVSFSVGTGIAAVGEPFPFTNTTTGTNLALWNFGDQTFSSEFSPVHTYSDAYTDSTVQVYLIGLNASGCVDTAYQNVTVRPAELDLALETLFLQENGTFDFLGVKMKNEGTVSVKKVAFEVFSDKGPLFQETWNGNLLPTKDTIYVFLSQPSLQFSTEDEKEAYVCVNSVAYDWQNEAETLLENNDRCINLEGDGVILTTIAPNPASNEVGFQLLVTKTSTISAELIDMNGKRAKILIPSTSVEPGIVDLKADIRTLENGVYFLQFTSNGSTTTQRLVVLQ